MNPDNYPDDLSEADRLRCMFDELAYGAYFVVDTPDGPQRLDPTEVTVSHE